MPDTISRYSQRSSPRLVPPTSPRYCTVNSRFKEPVLAQNRLSVNRKSLIKGHSSRAAAEPLFVKRPPGRIIGLLQSAGLPNRFRSRRNKTKLLPSFFHSKDTRLKIQREYGNGGGAPEDRRTRCCLTFPMLFCVFIFLSLSFKNQLKVNSAASLNLPLTREKSMSVVPSQDRCILLSHRSCRELNESVCSFCTIFFTSLA